MIHSTAVANFKMWPDEEDYLEGYGDEMVKEITEHYSKHFVEVQQVEAERPLLRNAIFEAFGNNMETLTWQKVNRSFGKEYPHALSLFDLILSIPATSAACEQGFSHMKLIKSDHRSLMKEAQLSNSLIIKLEGQGIKDFDPDKAIDIWFQKCS